MIGTFQNKHSGFALIELMIALFIFAIFMAIYATSQGYNLTDSARFKMDLKLSSLAEQKINQIILEPPEEFNKSITMGPGDTKTFEDQDQYESTVKYKEFILPQLSKIMGEDSEDGSAEKNNPFEEKIFSQIKESMEKLIWQVEVTVKNKNTGETFTVTSLLLNHKAKIEIKGI